VRGDAAHIPWEVSPPQQASKAAMRHTLKKPIWARAGPSQPQPCHTTSLGTRRNSTHASGRNPAPRLRRRDRPSRASVKNTAPSPGRSAASCRESDSKLGQVSCATRARARTWVRGVRFRGLREGLGNSDVEEDAGRMSSLPPAFERGLEGYLRQDLPNDV